MADPSGPSNPVGDGGRLARQSVVERGHVDAELEGLFRTDGLGLISPESSFFFFKKISACLSYQRMLRHWTALHPGVVVIFRPI